jgi:hypothetical protein
MRKLEKEQGGKWVETRNTRQDKQFVRQAASGGWRATLPAACVSRIETTWGPLMKTLGYAISTEEVSPAPSYAGQR